MSTEAHDVRESPRRAQRRRAVVIIGRSLLVSSAVVAGFFVLPLPALTAPALGTGTELLGGLAVVTALLAWQIRGILRSPLPAVQAVAALAITVPLFLVLYATTYFLIGDSTPDDFSEPLTRLDALYFTITTFTTVGFGDITAVSQGARGVVMTQMVLGMVLIGVIARVIVGAVQVARTRQRSQHGSGPGEGS